MSADYQKESAHGAAAGEDWGAAYFAKVRTNLMRLRVGANKSDEITHCRSRPQSER